MKGIEPSYEAWEAAVLPLNYTRSGVVPRRRAGAEPRIIARDFSNLRMMFASSFTSPSRGPDPVVPIPGIKYVPNLVHPADSAPARLLLQFGAMNTPNSANHPANSSADTPATPSVNTSDTTAGSSAAAPAAAPVSPETQAALASTAHAPNSPGATHIRSFVHRRGHITQGQLAALERLMGEWSIPYAPRRLDPAAAFGRQAPTVLEIGFGMGETTEKIALARPDDNFLGVEVFNAGVGSLLRRIEDSKIQNLRIIQHDAVEVVRDMIAPDSLAGVHVYFPDPWPKKRHHKRRLLQPAFVSLLASRIAPGGYIHCATDWEDYAVQMLEVLSGEPLLANTADGYAPRPDYRPLTKFETRGLRLGHGVWDLIFKRVA